MSNGTWRWLAGFGLAFCIALGASVHDRPAAADENLEKVAADREKAMKSLGASMRVLNGFIMKGRGEAADASGAVATIAAVAPTIPALFPPGTGMEEIFESEAKEVIWQEWEAFVAASEQLGVKAGTLQAALASGDSTQMSEAFTDLGKNGCGGCHRKFREKTD